MSGPGNWTLNGANTYSGYTNVSGGTLALASGAFGCQHQPDRICKAGHSMCRALFPVTAALIANGTVNFGPSTAPAILIRKLFQSLHRQCGCRGLANAANHQYRNAAGSRSLTFAANTAGSIWATMIWMHPARVWLRSLAWFGQGYNNGAWTRTGINEFCRPRAIPRISPRWASCQQCQWRPTLRQRRLAWHLRHHQPWRKQTS